MAADDHQNAPPEIAGARMAVLAAHLSWLFLGPLTLMLLLMGILQTGSGWVTGMDVAFFLIVGLMLVSRWFEQHSGQAITVMGKPSTWKDFRQYAVGLPLLAFAAWGLANVLANHVVGGAVEM